MDTRAFLGSCYGFVSGCQGISMELLRCSHWGFSVTVQLQGCSASMQGLFEVVTKAKLHTEI